MSAPILTNLDERQERRLGKQREVNEDGDDPGSVTERLAATLTLPYETSSTSPSSSQNGNSPLHSSGEWAQSNMLDALDDDDEESMGIAYDGQDWSDGDEEEKVRRRKRVLLKYKRRLLRKRQRAVSTQMSDGDVKIPSPDSNDELASNLEDPNRRLPRTLSGGSSADTGSDSFFDAIGSSPSSSGDRRISLEGDNSSQDASWLLMASKPTASSATLRQDAESKASTQHLQHQDSSATLLGINESDAYPKRNVIPPPKPTPSSPLPAAPSSAQPDWSSTEIVPSELQQLGPTGTIRGRPRGSTLGSLSHSTSDARFRIRPRSLVDDKMSKEQREAMGEEYARLDASVDAQKSRDMSPNITSSSASSLKRSSLTNAMFGSSILAEGAPSVPITNSSSAASSASSVVERKQDHIRSSNGGSSGLLQQVQQRTRSQASFVIAVVGHQGAGKSTVIKKGLRQFGLSKPQRLADNITSHSTVCIVDHEQRTIEVLEMGASVLLNGPSKRFAWPKFLPHIDAAILCYDASEIASFRGMSELLENFALNHLCTVMLACKSELHPKAVDPYYASDMASVYNVGLAECSVQSEEGKKRMRDCFSYLVKEVAKSRAVHHDQGGVPLEDLAVTQENIAPDILDDRQSKTSVVSSRRRNTDRKLSDVTVGSVDGASEEEALQQSINRAKLGLQSAKSAGGYVSIEELWDKLFFAAVSGNDERFLLMFMTFYRGFAQPIDLLRQIISRFDALARGEKSDGVMIRYSLMKLTTMLGDWMYEYPGDLSSPETHALLCDFFERIISHPSTMHVAAPMRPLLDIVKGATDLDAAWSKNQDNDKPNSVAADVPPVKPGFPYDRPASNSSSAQDTPPVMLKNRHRSASDVTHSSDGQHSHASGSSGHQTSTGMANSATSSGAPHTIPIVPNSVLTPNERKTVLRNTAAAILELSEEMIAHELTRIEWDLFSNIGPRDLLRHILVSRDLRAPDSPVARSIAHFNYLSDWICSLVVVHSKAKQRARMLEKFIGVASILRRINNYNTLNIIIAALGNSAIHRLKQTFDLIKGKRVYKMYLSLSRLMCSDRSFAAYRLALENSDVEGRRIPYLGVHLQDILSTSDGNSSKRASDGMIHWRKFSLMYDAVAAIIQCQAYQMPLQPNPHVSRLILDSPILDEDTMYQRSLQVEPRAPQLPAAAGSSGSRMIKQLFHVDQ